MRKLFRTALLSAMTLLFVPSATLFVRIASAATPTDRKTTKKKSRRKYNSKKLILKGHHGKHKGKPA